MSEELPHVDFNRLVNDLELAEVARRLYDELAVVKAQPAPTSTVLLAGSLLEILLLDRLRTHQAEALRAYEILRRQPPWDAIEDWPLKDLLEVAAVMGLVGTERADLTPALLEFRHHTTPSDILVQATRLVEDEEAQRFAQLVVEVIEDLAARPEPAEGR